jgi:hypothetical protein
VTSVTKENNTPPNEPAKVALISIQSCKGRPAPGSRNEVSSAFGNTLVRNSGKQTVAAPRKMGRMIGMLRPID